MRFALLVFTGCLLFGAAAPSALAATDVTWPMISQQDVPLQTIHPKAPDGHETLAFLRKPPGDGPFPAVILVHGGAPGWDEKTLHDFALHVHASRFLAAGYVVVAMTRRDLDLALPFDQEQKPVLDADAVFDYVSALPYVDSRSVVVRGTSVGGYLTLEIAAHRKPAAIVVEEPFSFPFVNVKIRAANPEADPRKIARIDSPILLIRGDQTAIINDFNKKVFIPEVMKLGRQIDILTFPGEKHSFSFYDSPDRTIKPVDSLEAFRAMDSFYRRYMPTQPMRLPAKLVKEEPIADAPYLKAPG